MLRRRRNRGTPAAGLARASVESGYRASRLIVSIREPVTAASAGISHSPSAALRIGVKDPPLRSAEHGEHRRRKRRHRFAVDDGAGAAVISRT